MPKPKTPKLRVIELEHGRPFEEVIPALLEQYGSLDAVAKALDVSQVSLYFWIKERGGVVNRSHQTTVTFPREEQLVG